MIPLAVALTSLKGLNPPLLAANQSYLRGVLQQFFPQQPKVLI
ncbi:hypothetical protein SeseC_02451 [Streptococcus equi subsp. zooepidemicus ATCC 35246]|nr:hypothetical protein SeseC_02451 [Streptococcus equi subsp. zooepidemicus ATCC 35246]